MKANDVLRTLYLDYVNNYLTIDKFASDHGIHSTDARRIIAMGKVYHEDHVTDSSRETIAVYFRKFEDGDVIALWDDGDHGQWISSYQHIGQHSEASHDLTTELAVATPGEYGPLKLELETRGYNVTLAE